MVPLDALRNIGDTLLLLTLSLLRTIHILLEMTTRIWSSLLVSAVIVSLLGTINLLLSQLVISNILLLTLLVIRDILLTLLLLVVDLLSLLAV